MMDALQVNFDGAIDMNGLPSKAKRNLESKKDMVIKVTRFGLLIPCFFLLLSNASAQTAAGLTAFLATSTDENGVDLVSGFTSFSLDDLSIGSGKSALPHSISSRPNGFNGGYGFYDNYIGGMRQVPLSNAPSPQCYPAKAVEIAGSKSILCGDDTNGYTEYRYNDAHLENINSTTYYYTNRDGVRYTLTSGINWNGGFVEWRLSQINYPDGQEIRVYYSSADTVQAVTHNGGFQLLYEYQHATITTLPTRITAFNTTVDYCAPTAASCSFSRAWPSATYDWMDVSSTESQFIVTDMGGQTTRYTSDVYDRVTKVKPAGASVDTIEYFYCQHFVPIGPPCPSNLEGTSPSAGAWAGSNTILDKVYKVERNGKTWNYVYDLITVITPNTSILTHTMTSEVGRSKQVTAQSNNHFTLGKVSNNGVDVFNFSFGYVPPSVRNRISTVVRTDQFDVQHYYDSRGNLTRLRKFKAGMTDVNTYAGFTVSCSPLTDINCNKPNWVDDGLGNRTDYTYDVTHGGLLKVTGPAVDGVRPETRNTYQQKYAYVKNSGGGYSQASSPIWQLTKQSTCISGAASGAGCAGPNDEVVTAYDYGPTSGPNNLFLRGTAVTADGATLRICYSYDDFGNQISQTAPKAGLTSCP